MKDIKNYNFKELSRFFKKNGYPEFYAQQVFNWVYKKRVEDFNLMTDISRGGRKFLKENFYLSKLKLIKREVSCDGTEKFLFSLEDKNYIEAVVIPKKERNTLCLSTQVGCKFKCTFCLSGKAGFERDLKASEIINQYLEASKLIAPNTITNIVFMGIGEPLDNFLNTVKAIEIFTESKGIHFSKRKISISTCGLIPGIRKLNTLNLGVKLSISLHTADNALRSKIMPINKKYPLVDLIKEAKAFSKKQKYPVTFEYALIGGFNTTEEEVRKLAKLLAGMSYKINLIPLNYCYGEFRLPTKEEIEKFSTGLKKKNILFTLRKPRGQDINAACGQLRAIFK